MIRKEAVLQRGLWIVLDFEVFAEALEVKCVLASVWTPTKR